jgi:hypothetical protein
MSASKLISLAGTSSIHFVSHRAIFDEADILLRGFADHSGQRL